MAMGEDVSAGALDQITGGLGKMLTFGKGVFAETLRQSLGYDFEVKTGRQKTMVGFEFHKFSFVMSCSFPLKSQGLAGETEFLTQKPKEQGAT